MRRKIGPNVGTAEPPTLGRCIPSGLQSRLSLNHHPRQGWRLTEENEMNELNNQNTEGYTQQELDALNAEWEKIVNELGLESGTDDYYREAQAFADKVAQR
jgi:hypothetical protein